MSKPTAIKHSLLALIILLVCTACSASASRHPGFADLDSLGYSDIDQVMSLSIGPLLLNFAAVLADDDPDAQRILGDLKGVRLKVYEIEDNHRRIWQRMDTIRDGLLEDGWDTMLKVNETDEQVRILVKLEHNKLAGMTILSADETEAVIINLIGSFEPQAYGQILSSLDIDNPIEG